MTKVVISNTGKYNLDDIDIGNNTSANGTFTYLKVNATDAMYLPTGNTIQRSTNTILGSIRYNTLTNKFEGYANTGWVSFNTTAA